MIATVGAQKRVSVAPKGNSFMYGWKENSAAAAEHKWLHRGCVSWYLGDQQSRNGATKLLNQFDTKARVCYNTGDRRLRTAGNNTK